MSCQMKQLHKRRLVKVRTGCITCKIRKVKCDEGKPACQRCTDSGRKCDGYVAQIDPQHTDQQSLVTTTRPPWVVSLNGVFLYADSASLSHIICPEQRQWLQYFSLEVGPTLSGLADREFWSTKLPQLSFDEPAIRHAILAVSSLYSSLKHSANTNQEIEEEGYRYSVNQYNLSIASLRQHMSPESEKPHLPLICCLLYICLECLYGDRSLVLDHLRNGLNIFSSPTFKDMQSSITSSMKPHLEQILRRLDAQSTLFGQPASYLFGVPSIETVSVVNTTFNDIFGAQYCLDALTSVSLNFVRYHHDRATAGTRDTQMAWSTLNHLKAKYKAWDHSIKQLMATSGLHDLDFQNSISRLRIQYYASFIYVSNCLDWGECTYDAFQEEFGNIVRLAGALAESPSNSTTSSPMSNESASSMAATSSLPIFALDASVIPSLYLTALKCREPTIRREAIRLLDNTPGREGLWDAKLHGRAAHRVMVIEESAMAISRDAVGGAMRYNSSVHSQAQDVIPDTLPEERCRVQSADIHRNPIGGLRTATINFLTAPEGLDQPWERWSEDVDF